MKNIEYIKQYFLYPLCRISWIISIYWIWTLGSQHMTKYSDSNVNEFRVKRQSVNISAPDFVLNYFFDAFDLGNSTLQNGYKVFWSQCIWKMIFSKNQPTTVLTFKINLRKKKYNPWPGSQLRTEIFSFWDPLRS